MKRQYAGIDPQKRKYMQLKTFGRNITKPFLFVLIFITYSPSLPSMSTVTVLKSEKKPAET